MIVLLELQALEKKFQQEMLEKERILEEELRAKDEHLKVIEDEKKLLEDEKQEGLSIFILTYLI